MTITAHLTTTQGSPFTDYFYPKRGFSISIKKNRDKHLSEAGKAILKDRYVMQAYNQDTEKWINLEESPQEVFARSACAYGTDKEHAQRLYDYTSKSWAMFSTPILTNAGNDKGLPISCFLSEVKDSKESILAHHYENGFLASLGGGIGSSWDSLRANGTRTSAGNVSTGVIPFMCMMDTQMNAFQQGKTRRGSYAAYLSVSHPEIDEFLSIREHRGEDPSRRCLGTGFHHAVNIPDAFMEAVQDGNPWDLVDPHTTEVKETVDARGLWMKILKSRIETGEPYLHFIDTSNKALPKSLKDKGLRINNSNLCCEIMLPTSEERTAVCCLSSVNLEHYAEWKDDPFFIPDMLEMLDNVLSSFIEDAPPELAKAVHSAVNERSVGLGSMGFHLLLQKKGIAFESPMATTLNKQVFSHIKERAVEASKNLAELRGEAPDMQGSGLRFSHLMAIAPNANIATICGGTSPSIEPFSANIFKQPTLSGTFIIKNKQLDKVLKDKYGLNGKELGDVWQSILVKGGSVQHLDFIDEIDKSVFKTAMELDQLWIIEHAAVRQDFVCQGQSVNVFLPPDTHRNTLHRIHFTAWKKGLKGLYYCRSEEIRKTTSAADIGKDVANTDISMDVIDCLACEG